MLIPRDPENVHLWGVLGWVELDLAEHTHVFAQRLLVLLKLLVAAFAVKANVDVLVLHPIIDRRHRRMPLFKNCLCLLILLWVKMKAGIGFDPQMIQLRLQLNLNHIHLTRMLLIEVDWAFDYGWVDDRCWRVVFLGFNCICRMIGLFVLLFSWFWLLLQRGLSRPGNKTIRIIQMQLFYPCGLR